MCVDFRDLNKACPKDDFPLPHIDVIIDSTASSAMYSFMDGFLGYNQIMMAVMDKIKIIFITKWGTHLLQSDTLWIKEHRRNLLKNSNFSVS